MSILSSQSQNPDLHEIQQCIERINNLNPDLNALVPGSVISQSDLEKSLNDLPKGRLHGVTLAIKDNINVKDWEVTCASSILKNYKSLYDATVIQKLRSEGALFIGRANMDEFAFGSSCETSCYGPTKNPWNQSYSPGGSSGGSAACVSAGFTTAALGSDTGGSIRQPASFCGVVGLKPTYGRVSRYGLIAFGSSLDQIGPFTTNIEDSALLLEIMAGKDANDSTSADVPVDEYSKSVGESIKGMKIGLPKEFFDENLPNETKQLIQNSADLLAKEGAEIIEVSLPHTKYAVSAYYVIGPSEASSNLSRFDGVRFGNRDLSQESLIKLYTQTRQKGFGSEAKRRIVLGTYALSSGYYDAFYLKAMKVRAKMIEDFRNAFKVVDCILTPTSPGSAFKIGEKINDPLQMYLSDIYTISANLSGVPALSIPCGFSENKMPIGAQLMTKAFDEKNLFKVAYALQEKLGLKDLSPDQAVGECK